MNTVRAVHLPRRTPGEVAFDRSFFLMATFFGFSIVTAAVRVISSPFRVNPDPEQASEVAAPWWAAWLGFGVGLVVAFFWLRAFVGVVRVWRDPSARILRLSALGLLLPTGWVVLYLLHLPF